MKQSDPPEIVPLVPSVSQAQSWSDSLAVSLFVTELVSVIVTSEAHSVAVSVGWSVSVVVPPEDSLRLSLSAPPTIVPSAPSTSVSVPVERLAPVSYPVVVSVPDSWRSLVVQLLL